MLQQNACWDAWRVLNQGLSLWVKICKIKSHEVSRGCKRTKTMARNGMKKWLCSLFKTLQFLYFKLKSYPNTCRDINAFRRHTRSRQLRLISTPRLGKLSAHTIITSDSQMTWIHRTHNYLNIALQTLHYHPMSAWSAIQPYRNVINSLNMYRCILTWTICLWWWSGQWVS